MLPLAFVENGLLIYARCVALNRYNKFTCLFCRPYCRNVVRAEETPLEQLKDETKSRDTKLCT